TRYGEVVGVTRYGGLSGDFPEEATALAPGQALACQGCFHAADRHVGILCCAFLDGGLFQPLIGTAVLDGLVSREPRLGIHEVRCGGLVHAGAPGIDPGQRVVEGVQHVGYFPQVVAVADHDAPHVVDHHEAAIAHADGVAGHGDHRRGRGREAHDVDRHRVR